MAVSADRDQAYWLSAARQPDAWTRHVFTTPRYGPLPVLFAQPYPVLHQAAPVLPLGAPTLRVLTDSSGAGQRYLRLLVLAGRKDVTSISLTLETAAGVRPLRVAGHAVAAADLALGATSIHLTVQAPRAAGELLELALANGQPLRVSATTRSLGLAALPPLPPLPTDFVAMPGYNSFTTQVRREFQF